MKLDTYTTARLAANYWEHAENHLPRGPIYDAWIPNEQGTEDHGISASFLIYGSRGSVPTLLEEE